MAPIYQKQRKNEEININRFGKISISLIGITIVPADK